jgi:hypothetical protein
MTITLSSKRIDVESNKERSDEIPGPKTHCAEVTKADFDTSADSPLRHNNCGEGDDFAWKSVRNCISIHEMACVLLTEQSN